MAGRQKSPEKTQKKLEHRTFRGTKRDVEGSVMAQLSDENPYLSGNSAPA